MLATAFLFFWIDVAALEFSVMRATQAIGARLFVGKHWVGDPGCFLR